MNDFNKVKQCIMLDIRPKEFIHILMSLKIDSKLENFKFISNLLINVIDKQWIDACFYERKEELIVVFTPSSEKVDYDLINKGIKDTFKNATHNTCNIDKFCFMFGIKYD